MGKLFIFVFAVLLLVLLLQHERQPDSSAFMRGQQLAKEHGCSGCHNDTQAMANPAALRTVIPPAHSGASLDLFWVENREEFSEWVRQGVSNRIKRERAALHDNDPAAIRMPAFATALNPQQISDLYVYFRDNSAFPKTPAGAIEHGETLAASNGCFACHGLHGLAGSTNPGSFKGYIPPWEGDDFHAMAKNDAELREWIQTGSLKRFEQNPVAHYFLHHQSIQMPVYGNRLSEADIHDLIAYMHWLPDRTNSKQNASVTQTTDSGSDGQTLFLQSGCTTCHRPEGAQGFVDRHGNEIPPRSRLAFRLQSLSAIIKDREGHFSTDQLCHYYREFSQEYGAITHTIEHGRKITGLPSPGIATTDMPPWKDRANPERSHDLAEDPVALLTEYLSHSEQHATQWRSAAASCHDQAPAPSTSLTERREQIRHRIEALGAQHALFSTEPHVAFPSAEVHLFDLIGYVADHELDLWTLIQLPVNTDTANAGMRYDARKFPWAQRYVMAVDKSDVTYRAYFFINDLTPDPGTAPVYLHDDTMSDANLSGCFACHVSGPRLLRPMPLQSDQHIDAKQWQLIRDFNQRILGYGALTLDWPRQQQPPDADQLEDSRLEGCRACHATGNVQSPLLRYHRKPVDALLHLAEDDAGFYRVVNNTHPVITVMPPLLPWPDNQKNQIQHWFDHTTP